MTTAERRDLYERYQRHIASYCARRTNPDRVEDAVAEVFLVTWRRIGDVPEDEAALRWLYGVAHKVVGRQWRSTSRARRLADRLASLGVDPVPVPEELVVRRQEYDQVIDALSRLGRVDREILLLAAWEELRHQEIADVLGIQPAAVRQRFHKAKKRLTREFNRSEEPRNDRAPAAERGGVW